MDAQQLLDYIIKPALGYMEGNYNTKNAQILLLATAAIESNCGYYVKQINGPALGIWQTEPATHIDILTNCDAVSPIDTLQLFNLRLQEDEEFLHDNLIESPLYACAIARLKYAMDSEPLPDYRDKEAIYKYYKRVFNTEHGASTWEKFKKAWAINKLDEVML